LISEAMRSSCDAVVSCTVAHGGRLERLQPARLHRRVVRVPVRLVRRRRGLRVVLGAHSDAKDLDLKAVAACLGAVTRARHGAELVVVRHRLAAWQGTRP